MRSTFTHEVVLSMNLRINIFKWFSGNLINAFNRDIFYNTYCFKLSFTSNRWNLSQWHQQRRPPQPPPQPPTSRRKRTIRSCGSPRRWSPSPRPSAESWKKFSCALVLKTAACERQFTYTPISIPWTSRTLARPTFQSTPRYRTWWWENNIRSVRCV